MSTFDTPTLLLKRMSHFGRETHFVGGFTPPGHSDYHFVDANDKKMSRSATRYRLSTTDDRSPVKCPHTRAPTDASPTPTAQSTTPTTRSHAAAGEHIRAHPRRDLLGQRWADQLHPDIGHAAGRRGRRHHCVRHRERSRQRQHGQHSNERDNGDHLRGDTYRQGYTDGWNAGRAPSGRGQSPTEEHP